MWCCKLERGATRDSIFAHAHHLPLFYNEVVTIFVWGYEQGIFVWFNVPISASLLQQLFAQTCNVRTDIQLNSRL